MAVGKQQVLRSVAPLQPGSPPTEAAAPGLTAGDSPPRLAHRASPALREHVCVWELEKRVRWALSADHQT